VGAVLANLIGTTGASMLLLRPFLRANQHRRVRAYQIVFFLFVVSNCGGLLTPLGDPPLYLGFLKGVPFDWTLRLWPVWLLVNGLLIFVFNLYDQWALGREERARDAAVLDEVLEHEPLGIEGARNLPLLAGVVAVILGRGYGWGAGGGHWPFGVQEGLLVGLAVVSYLATRPEVRARNRFNFSPIVEVAVVFAGIFVTMVAPLEILNAHGAALGLTRPWQYFWATGALSAFLDNAPTYLAFTAAAAGVEGVSTADPRFLSELLGRGGESAEPLAAISAGAVLMGAMTYIGNGPNFMVKAIAEDAGVRMPSFFGYLGWSLVVLLPVFGVTSLIFF
jgi:Na+/H+ antiporter NhaD/arsenite permease-like protein